jgi:hypothetical protein
MVHRTFPVRLHHDRVHPESVRLGNAQRAQVGAQALPVSVRVAQAVEPVVQVAAADSAPVVAAELRVRAAATLQHVPAPVAVAAAQVGEPLVHSVAVAARARLASQSVRREQNSNCARLRRLVA